MHIAIDASRATGREQTGTERYSFELIAALARSDRFNRYTLFTNGQPAALPQLGPNFNVHNVRAPRLWTHLRLGPQSLLSQADVLFVPAHVIPLVAAHRSVVTIHDLGYRAFPESHTRRRRVELDLTTRWSVQRATRVIAISQATKDALVQHYNVDPTRVAVVHHGLSAAFRPADTPAITTVCARYGLQKPFFLYIGTVQPRKNLARLIAAFRTIAERIGAIELVIAGKRGWLTEQIEAEAAHAGLGARVRFIGFVPDAELPALLSAARAFVFPSLYEGFGMPVLEAMGCGTPVLTANTSALPEIAGDAALLVDPSDTEAIAAALQQLADDAALRADLSARGLQRAAHFTWERCAEETLQVLRAAITHGTLLPSTSTSSIRCLLILAAILSHEALEICRISPLSHLGQVLVCFTQASSSTWYTSPQRTLNGDSYE
ncbi:glycosyltransferase family 4 protein [Candidatus Gracilibacteria bacterium]|nr:glycosyltransferase family 4 protein [Candidatus Gracilibacteria bacterium]